MMQQGWFRGNLFHARFSPTKHKFSYKDNMFLIKIPMNNKISKIGFFTKINFFKYGYSSPKLNLKQEIISKAPNLNIDNHKDYDVYLMTRPAQFGFQFNPISFYFIYQNNQLLSILLEVSNTPWNEKILYPLDISNSMKDPESITINQIIKKQMHVSPFNDINQSYKIYLRFNDRELNCKIDVLKNEIKLLSASLNLTSVSSNSISFKVLNLFYNFKVLFRIYYQALKLFLKKTPVYKKT